MASLATKTPGSIGPAANPKFLSAIDPSNPYNYSDLLLGAAKLGPVVTDTHIFFFGHEGTDPHICLDQWFPSPFVGPRNPYKNDNTLISFPTAEHFMMYHKALVMNDDETAARVLTDENAHPSRAKALGREVKNFDGDLWREEADRVVEEGNLRKFGQREELREVLLGTGDRTLVEASPEDKIWGIGFRGDQAEGKEDQWGKNRLGQALMKAREKLRTEQEAER